MCSYDACTCINPMSTILYINKGMILTDVTGDDSPKPMTKELLKKIFIFYKGEFYWLSKVLISYAHIICSLLTTIPYLI